MVKKTIFLFLIFILLLLWYFLYEGKFAKKREEKKSFEKKLFKIDKKEDIERILIKNQEKEIEILKENNKWIIKANKKFDADRDEIETILNKISSLEIERNLGNVENLEKYGLSEEKKKIEIEYNGRKFLIYIGEQTPSGNHLYATKDKKEVFLVLKWDINSILEKGIFDLRDKRIIPADILSSDIKEIEIKGRNFYASFKKKDRWNIISPINDWADKNKLENIIEYIIDGKIKEFNEDKNEKDCGLENPKFTFKISDGKNDYYLYIGKKNGDLYYAKNSIKNFIFSIEGKIIKEIPENIEDFRSRKIFDFEQVNEFSIIRKNKHLKFFKENDRYISEKDKVKKFSKDKIEDFLFDLKYLEIKDFIGYSEKSIGYNLENPEIKIIIISDKGKIEVSFGKKKENEIYCYHIPRNLIFTIPSSDWSKIDKEEKDFIEEKKKK